MRRSFTLLDSAIDAVNDMTENSDSLDGIRVKAVFYAIFFGEDTPSRRAHKQFVDCFVTYEERTRTVTAEDGTTAEESYTVAIPITDMTKVYENIESALHLQISEEQKSNADSVYNLVRYGVAGGSEGWIPGADVPFIGADGFCSPIGSGWERRVTSEFGNRVDPITGKRKGHTGMDLAVPTGTPIRAALPGTVTVSKYNAGGYGYYVMIDHGNGLATLYGHCSKLLAKVGQTVEAGDIIALSGSHSLQKLRLILVLSFGQLLQLFQINGKCKAFFSGWKLCCFLCIIRYLNALFTQILINHLQMIFAKRKMRKPFFDLLFCDHASRFVRRPAYIPEYFTKYNSVVHFYLYPPTDINIPSTA